jgi:hypothetical protein
MGCWAGKPLDGLTEDDFAGITADLEHAAHLSSSAQLEAQLADVRALRDDAQTRGWHSEVARHARVITSLQGHIQRLKPTAKPQPPA